MFLFIPISGSLTLGECTVEPMIPYFLIISGITYIIFLPMTILCTVWSKTNACLSCYNGVFLSCVAVFSFAWFICGNVWVYHIRNVEFEDKKSPLYCNELVYQFSFWVIIATYICAVLSCCLSAVFKKQKYDSLKWTDERSKCAWYMKCCFGHDSIFTQKNWRRMFYDCPMTTNLQQWLKP